MSVDVISSVEKIINPMSLLQKEKKGAVRWRVWKGEGTKTKWPSPARFSCCSHPRRRPGCRMLMHESTSKAVSNLLKKI